ncbi:hypothetical protein BRCON_2023 [Candidatus Sumerlaea chitinivorans]|uniref:Uncharacterized protein n=1 Tax=Sumerlaea chitinivorans TaxID=2250252 RepID=A0A2Z4Y6G7_SUMC1|nr:hypothetical protein BRCON_2023 [Candidatus Sumerlaea chitinivorans]
MPMNLLNPVYHAHAFQPGSRIDIDRVLPASLDDEDIEEWIEKFCEPPRFIERISPVSTLLGNELVRGKNWTDMMLRAYRVFLRVYHGISIYIRQALVDRFGEHGLLPFMSFDMEPCLMERMIELDYEESENTYGTLMELVRSGVLSPAATVPFHVLLPMLDSEFDKRLCLRIAMTLYWKMLREYHDFIVQVHDERAFVMPFMLPEYAYANDVGRLLVEEFMRLAEEEELDEPHLVLLLDNQQAVDRDLDVLMKSWNMLQLDGKRVPVSLVFRDRAFSEWMIYSRPSVKKLIDRTIAKVDSDLNAAGINYCWAHFENIEDLTFDAKSLMNFEQKVIKLAQLSYLGIAPDVYVRRKLLKIFRRISHEPQLVELRNGSSGNDWHSRPNLGRWEGVLDSNAPIQLVDESRPYVRRTRTGKAHETGPQCWKIAFNRAIRTCARAVKGDPETLTGGALEVLAGICGAKDRNHARENIFDFLTNYLYIHWREYFIQHDLSEADIQLRDMVDETLLRGVRKRLKDEDYLIAGVAAQAYYFALDAMRSHATHWENLDQRAAYQNVVMITLALCNMMYIYHWRKKPAEARRLFELMRDELFHFESAYERYQLADYGVTEEEWQDALKSQVEDSTLNLVARAARRTAVRHLKHLGYKKEFTRDDELLTPNTGHLWTAEIENLNYKWENKLYCGLREE